MEGLQLSWVFGNGLRGWRWMIERETSDGQSEQYGQFELWKYDEQLHIKTDGKEVNDNC